MINNIEHKDHIKARIFLIAVSCLMFAFYFGPGGRIWETLFLMILISLSAGREWKAYPGYSTSEKVFLWGLIAFAVVNVIAMILAPDLTGMDYAHRDDEYFYGAVLALSLAFGSRGRSVARELLLIFMVGSSLYIIREILFLNPLVFTTDGRLSGLDGMHPNRLAMILLFMAATFLSGLQMMKSRITFLAGLVMFFIASYLLMLTDSRFALLTFGFVTIPATMFFQRRWGSFKQKMIVVCLIFLLLAPLGSLLWHVRANPDRRSLGNVYGRLAMWKGIAYFASEGPWYRTVIGHGDFEGTFIILADHYGFDLTPYPIGSIHAHNVAWQIFMETGIIGVVIIVLPWLAVINVLIRAWRVEDKEVVKVAGCLIVVFLTIVVSSQMDLTLSRKSGWLMFYLLGTSFALKESLYARSVSIHSAK